MPEARAERLIPAEAHQVFDFIADVANAPRWMFGVREVSGPERRPLREGDVLHIRLVAGGKLADSEWLIGACDRPTLLSSSGRAMGATAKLRIECADAGPEETLVTQSLEYHLPGGALGLLAARFGINGIMDLQASRSLQMLALHFGATTESPGTEAASLRPSE